MKFILILGIIFYLSGNVLMADDLDVLMVKINNNPGSYKTYNKIGMIYYERNNSIESEKFFIRAIILNNNYYEGYFNLGLLYYKQNNNIKALENFQRAHILNNEIEELYINLINTCLKINKISLAKKYLNKGFNKFDKKNYKLLNCSGIIELLLKDYKKAVLNFKEALKIENNNEIKNNLAIAEYYSGNKGEAEKILKEIGNDSGIIKENYKLIK